MALLRLITLLFIALGLFRCAREVIIDLPDEEPRVVAICHFTEGQHFRANISMSQAVNEGQDPEQPSNVEATLSINGAYYDVLYRVKGDGNDYYWRSHQAKLAEPGIEYALSVRVPGYTSVMAKSSIPQHYSLSPIVLHSEELYVETRNDGSKELRIPLELQLQNLPENERYFAFYLTHDTDVYDDSVVPAEFDHSEEQKPTNFLADGRTISLLHNIPEPVVLINENYWADNRKTLYLTARIPFNPSTDRVTKLYVTWRTLSPEFYKYHPSLSRQSGNIPLSDPDAVYNNMEGGLGNFSGYSVSVDTIDIPEF